MMLNCLIVDDEPLARQQIESYVQRVPFLKLVGTARNPVIAGEILQTELVDLIFLDIQMPQMSGIDFLKNNDIFQQIILITAFPEYAAEGFDLEVTDYLTKPVAFERFLKASKKALTKVSGSALIKSITDKPDFLYVKCNQRFEKIQLADILYIESMLNYIHIVTRQRKLTVYSSLKAIENSLPPDQFLRIHKSYMVAIRHIHSIDSREITVMGHQLPVSRSNKQAVLQIALNRRNSENQLK
jgi:DNA-binding LytR/AlgR family response regulator